MGYNIQISKAVIAEIDQSVEWYESKEKGLGDKFQKEFKSKINRIKGNPKLFQEIDVNHRRAVLGSSFPYKIHYFINDSTKTIKIIGVFHQIKNPDLINKQIRLRRIHDIKEEKNKRLNSRTEQLKKLRKRQELDRGKSRDGGLER